GLLRDGTARPWLAGTWPGTPAVHPAAAEQLPASALLRHRGRQREGPSFLARRGRRRSRGARQRLALRALAPLAGHVGPGAREPDQGREGTDPLEELGSAAEARLIHRSWAFR